MKINQAEMITYESTVGDIRLEKWLQNETFMDGKKPIV